MKILCISTSNSRLGKNSASTKVCELIKEISEEKDNKIEVLALVDYEISPCKLCGKCFQNHECVYDSAFNVIHEKILKADIVFFVVPHYSPIPSKLLILFEKINEVIYASYLNTSNYQSPYKEKIVGIIGHGGMVESENSLKYYHDHLVTPVANTLRSLSFQVIGASENYPNGSVFGLSSEDCYEKSEKLIFPKIIQDYTLIKNRIRSHVEKVISVKNNK